MVSLLVFLKRDKFKGAGIGTEQGFQRKYNERDPKIMLEVNYEHTFVPMNYYPRKEEIEEGVCWKQC